MRLKTLDIKGFKSFATETTIHFSEDVIGIVGPNGSGKSNVVDAIRWVLGEQKSSELRLDKMNSVIFNGTKKRKAGQMAQVTLTFENTKNVLPTDYSNIAITRILYASGESEYRLNGVTCRLKDITSLFMDTGVGSNSYAIIALGMVDDILNDKQNSRRLMFEQAAGISKYKARKHETMTKLNATEEDLNRIEDLLFEIENNLKTLEKQAKRTQRYFDLKEEYKILAVDLAVLKLSVFKSDYKATEARITKEMDTFRDLEIATTQLEARLEREKKNNIENEQLLSERQRELNSLVGRIRGAENDKKIVVQRQLFAEQNIQKLKQQIQEAKNKKTSLAEDIDYYQTEVQQEKRLEAKLEEQLETAKEELERIRSSHGNSKADLDRFLQQQQGVERQVIEQEKQKAIQQNQIENLHSDINRQHSDTENRRTDVEKNDALLTDLSQKIDNQQHNVQLLEKEEEERTQSLEHAQAKLDETIQQTNAANRTLDSQRNEYKLTKSMVESMEGFPESIQFLQKDKSWSAPLLSDVVFVQAEYRAAIENYLENYLGYYVVPNVEEAEKAIRLLSQAQKGKANFFILDAFAGQNFSTPEKKDWAVAEKMITVDAQYKTLFQYLLQNVYISDAEISEIGTQSNGIVLSKSGAFVSRQFSVAGGSVGLFEGKKIGRKKNLEILEKDIKTTEAQVATWQQEVQSIKAQIQVLKQNDKNRDIKTAKENLNQLTQNRAILTTKIENLKAILGDADRKKSEAEQNIRTLEDKNRAIEVQLIELKSQSQEIKMLMETADNSYRSVADQMSQLSAAYNEKNVSFIRQQNKVSTLQRELSFREKQLSEQEAQMTQSQKSLTVSEEEMDLTKQEIGDIDRQLQSDYQTRSKTSSGLSEFEQHYYKMRNEINTMEEEVRKQNRQRNDLQSFINQLKDKFSDLKVQIASIGERLQVEFNISVNDVINQNPKEGLNREETQKRVDSLKRQLDTYGEINPMAVEAYNEMKERYDTIDTQRNDIVAAKTSLLQTIQEIETTATAQFYETFNTVRTHFIEIFKSLFYEEDTADLILSDPENPLESTINIVAKPKGKRPQSIAQLSGGEKTLTATALLFALYLYKPAPFCIFDEVDAPLDDANIEKFNRIIKKFSKDSQFIIVTHNKATMEAVDIIYGVHMPEEGVSMVTPVDFRNYDHTAELEMKTSTSTKK